MFSYNDALTPYVEEGRSSDIVVDGSSLATIYIFHDEDSITADEKKNYAFLRNRLLPCGFWNSNREYNKTAQLQLQCPKLEETLYQQLILGWLAQS